MEYKEAIQRIRENPGEFFDEDRAKPKHGYICPICGSGSGKNGTGMTCRDGVHWTCWSCLSWGRGGADVIEILQKSKGFSSRGETLKYACGVLGIVVEDRRITEYTPLPNRKEIPETRVASLPVVETETETAKQALPVNKDVPVAQETALIDKTSFFLQANKDVDKTDYWKKRGLSERVIRENNLGYVNEWKHPKLNPQTAKKVPFSPRGILPISQYHYLARDVRDEDALNEIQRKYKKQKVGEGAPLYRAKFLYNDENNPIFIMEGEIDALSVDEAGGYACALGSVANIKLLFDELAKTECKERNNPLIIAMDFDKQGVRAVKEIVEKLNTPEFAHVPYIVQFISDPYKDANDYLVKEREQFLSVVSEAQESAKKAKGVDRQTLNTFAKNNIAYAENKIKEFDDLENLIQAEKELKRESLAIELENYEQEVEKGIFIEPISTGFEQLDSVLDGGLYPRLYTVGAISSLGKTSLCLQMANNFVFAGRDVLFISMEMEKRELQNKLISMHSLLASRELNLSTNFALTANSVGLWARDKDTKNNSQKAVYERAKALYREIGLERFHIVEGVGDVSVDVIREKVDRYFVLTGKAPILFVDYMQIIAPVDVRATDKQNIDKAVLELKRISRDYKTPVVCVSSFNRSSYDEPVNMTAFKESGAIEYSADVLIGLQYDGMDYKEKEKTTNDSDRRARIRQLLFDNNMQGEIGSFQKIQCKILKHRSGRRGECLLHFYPKFNYFEQGSDEKENTNASHNAEEWEGEGWKTL